MASARGRLELPAMILIEDFMPARAWVDDFGVGRHDSAPTGRALNRGVPVSQCLHGPVTGAAHGSSSRCRWTMK